MTKQKTDKSDLTEKNASIINKKKKKVKVVDSDDSDVEECVNPIKKKNLSSREEQKSAENIINSDSSAESSESVETSGSSESGESGGRKKPDFFIANPVKFFTTKELCHYKNIDKFFRDCHIRNPDILTSMIDIIESRSEISLRILDWFVTKYSKKKIPYGINKNTEVFDVRISYKAQLKGYKKRNFDPFRRRDKFYYPCNEEGYKLENGESKHVLTTLGQLNFFKWAFNNNIITYVEDNLDQIVTEMNNFTKDEKKKKLKIKEDEKVENEKRKSQIKDEPAEKIKVNAVKTKEKNEVKLVITFD
jgi:hypothetical protein